MGGLGSVKLEREIAKRLAGQGQSAGAPPVPAPASCHSSPLACASSEGRGRRLFFAGNTQKPSEFSTLDKLCKQLPKGKKPVSSWFVNPDFLFISSYQFLFSPFLLCG